MKNHEEELTLKNRYFDGKKMVKINSIERLGDEFLINGINSKSILFFDNSWLGGAEFIHLGFKEIGRTQYQRGKIFLHYFSFDHWHVSRGLDDFGERFYTYSSLESLVKDMFNEDLLM